MALAVWVYTIGMALYGVRGTILHRERDAKWVRTLPDVAMVTNGGTK